MIIIIKNIDLCAFLYNILFVSVIIFLVSDGRFKTSTCLGDGSEILDRGGNILQLWYIVIFS